MATKKKTRDRQIGIKLLLLLVSFIVALVLSEATLQVLGQIHPNLILKKKIGGNHPADLIHSDGKLDYALTPLFNGRDINPFGDFNVAVNINQHGFRDIDRSYDPNHFYIMAVGDSIMYGEGVELEESFLALLEKRFQETTNPAVQVIKAGVPGYSEKQALDFLESKFEIFKPKVVILGVTPKESWRNTSGYKNEQGFIVDSRLKKQYFRFGNELYASHFRNRRLAYLEAWSDAHFILPTFLRQRRKFIIEHLSSPRKRGSNSLDSRIRGNDKELEISAEELSPTLKEIDRFLELSRARGFTPVIFIKGYHLQAGRIVSDYAKEKNLAALDLAPLFKVGEGKVVYTFRHDGHWNSSTHRMVSEILYNFLITQTIIPEKPKAA